jgi:hypothetical protein
VEAQCSSRVSSTGCRKYERKVGKETILGCNIVKLTDATGVPIKYLINKTMMRVDLGNSIKARSENGYEN